MPISRENVRLSRLWEVYTKTKIGDEEIYIRALSDAEQKEADEVAAHAGYLYKQRLENPETREHAAWVGSFLNADRKIWENTIIASRIWEFRRQAQTVIFPPYVPQVEEAEARDGLVQSERAEVIAEREKAFAEYQQKLSQFIQERLDELREYLATLDDETLKRTALEHRIELKLREEVGRTYINHVLYLACYRDENLSRRLFSSPEDVSKLPQTIRNHLHSAFLEINEFDPLS